MIYAGWYIYNPGTPSKSTSSLPILSSPTMLAYPSTMYVTQPQQQQYYYVQQPQASNTAGQWPVVYSGSNGYVYSAGGMVHQQPTMTQAHPTAYGSQPLLRTAVSAAPRPMTAAQPISIPGPTTRPPLQRQSSSANSRRGSLPLDADDFMTVSPVLSDSTLSSSSGSSASHLNLPRSAINHYMAPQRSRRPSLVQRRSSYELAQPQHSTGPRHPALNGQLSAVPRSEPPLVRPKDLSGRPISFHNEQNGLYSSYELYQPTSRSHPPTTRPTLIRRSSSRSLSGSELSASSYGSGLGMGGSGGYGNDNSGKGRWFKR